MALFCVWIWAQTSKKVYNASRIIICKFPKVKRAQKGPKARKRRVYSKVFVIVTVIVLTNVCLY